ncbi:hypothetical protein VJ918_07845 [Adlercreutzia sp. R21]|uniref:hypothetical protein n=1 Tax=Adlercreutzia wanghongyangiae TaxID=3111451 RepID=UPI002DBED1BC|nr:hypothetical protein [Adlercreutzia sp. R21]MEC4184718.1 hypothetical protein [Adlercreutzia sp. R21]
MKNAKNTVITVAMVAALAAAGVTAGCTPQNYVPDLDTPGIITAASDDAVKAAGEKAEADRQAAYAAEQAARASENARKAIEAKEAALDEAALDGGEIVDDANAPEGTVAVRTATGETRYVTSDKAQQSVDSGKTAPKKSESASNGGSGSSNKGGNSSSGNSGSSNSGSNNSSASEPAPHVHDWVAYTWSDPDTVEKDWVFNQYCPECGYTGTTGGKVFNDICPNCGEICTCGKQIMENRVPGAIHTGYRCSCGAEK